MYGVLFDTNAVDMVSNTVQWGNGFLTLGNIDTMVNYVLYLIAGLGFVYLVYKWFFSTPTE